MALAIAATEILFLLMHLMHGHSVHCHGRHQKSRGKPWT
ncbi:hypothetical protein [Polaromonas sp. CG9_12]|nr:hypothetical protein [Polaromonas sp. CG9_12]